ncbi:hypothetical protein FOMPIDRAFT_1024014 [Fomitopsis schrenkii]|uniref:Uncharacterized protein n=1 Tax=Fomitopsis schrenkii TaxID=2126942 RepID=S8FED1_FOMSC|nr:hypothetical protein FOMPIDRAFT_1024014 [Fomitopsis schrenkii]
MPLVRAAGTSLRPRLAAAPVLRSRLASSHAHEEHHDDHHGEAHDSTVYPRESFSGPFWRRFALATIGVVAFYQFAPAPGEENRLSAGIAEYTKPAEFWDKLTVKHLLQTVEVSDGALLIGDAKPAPVHRYRYPQRFEQGSPHLQPVGLVVDVSDVVPKNV